MVMVTVPRLAVVHAQTAEEVEALVGRQRAIDALGGDADPGGVGLAVARPT